MGAHVQFLKRVLRLGGREIEGIVGGESEALHPLAQAGDETEVSTEDLAKPIGLGGSDVG